MILIVLYLAESQMKILRCFPSSLHIVSKHIIFTIPGLVTMKVKIAILGVPMLILLIFLSGAAIFT